MIKKDYTNLFRLTPKEEGDVEELTETPGTVLKQERIRQGLTLDDVAEATTISVRSLRALEENDRDSLPAQAFVRGFIIIYSNHLRLDPENLLEKHRQQEEESNSSENEINAHAIIKLNPVAGNYWFSPFQMLLLLISIIMLTSFMYWGYTHFFTYNNESSTMMDVVSEMEDHPKEAVTSPTESLSHQENSASKTGLINGESKEAPNN